jgi:hypothetical protein
LLSRVTCFIVTEGTVHVTDFIMNPLDMTLQNRSCAGVKAALLTFLVSNSYVIMNSLDMF